MRGRNSGSLC